jgi:phenylacetate-CoA ligase
MIRDPTLECLDAAELYRRFERPRLERQLEYVVACSPFYRRKFRAFGHDGRTLVRRFSELPFSGKAEFLSDQSEHPPFGSNLCVNSNDIRRVHKTSGTGSLPLLIAMTTEDIATTVICGARSFTASGLGPGHTVAHCLNYCLWMGGFTDHQSLEATGAAVVPWGVGNTHTLLQRIQDVQIDAIHCTPSYMAILDDVLVREFGMQPRDLGLKLGLFGCEPGIDCPGFRDAIESRWGMRAMNANYGLAEVLSIIGGECRAKTGFHFVGQGSVMVELIHPESLERLPIEAGVEGEFVLTNTNRRAQPVVRYRTGDVVRIVGHERCRCGRSSFRFQVKGRTDDMLVVRGVNVHPGAVRTVLARYLDKLTLQFQIVVETPPPLQTILVRAERLGRVSKAACANLTKRLREDLRTQLGTGLRVELVPLGTLSLSEGKARLIVRSYLNQSGGRRV